MLPHMEHVTLSQQVIGNLPQYKPKLVVIVFGLLLGLNWDANIR
jgi:hypothetical protein